nr:winged helix-turn-helix domain-containing protein [Streptomyces physcomitrii]
MGGDQLLKVLNALGNPHRMRIVAALAGGRNYVSALARQIGMGRPLLHMHLQRLEAAGLVVGSLELSEDGKAMRFYELAPFRYELTPETVSRAAPTLTEGEKGEKGDGSGRPGKGEGEGEGEEQPAGNRDRDRDKKRTTKPGPTGRTQEERTS